MARTPPRQFRALAQGAHVANQTGEKQKIVTHLFSQTFFPFQISKENVCLNFERKEKSRLLLFNFLLGKGQEPIKLIIFNFLSQKV